MSNPLISILMPARNSSKYVAETIHSIQGQTFTNWELIIVDDFSSDETFKICGELAQTDKRIKVLRNIDKGIVPALNMAFENSGGSYITRMDSDDLMPINKIAFFVKAITDSRKEVITAKVKYFSENEVSRGYQDYEKWLNERIDLRDHYKHVYRECVVASPNWMVHRSCFENDIKLAQLSYPEDYDMVLKWYKHSYSISVVDELTHLWREHPERTSRNSDHYQQKAFFHLKTERFLEIEKPRKVQLVGSGVKSKLVATVLEENDIPFTQFSFDNKFMDIQELKAEIQTIQTAWPKNKLLQTEIEEFLNSKGLFFGENCWLF